MGEFIELGCNHFGSMDTIQYLCMLFQAGCVYFFNNILLNLFDVTVKITINPFITSKIALKLHQDLPISFSYTTARTVLTLFLQVFYFAIQVISCSSLNSTEIGLMPFCFGYVHCDLRESNERILPSFLLSTSYRCKHKVTCSFHGPSCNINY